MKSVKLVGQPDGREQEWEKMCGSHISLVYQCEKIVWMFNLNWIAVVWLWATFYIHHIIKMKSCWSRVIKSVPRNTLKVSLHRIYIQIPLNLSVNGRDIFVLDSIFFFLFQSLSFSWALFLLTFWFWEMSFIHFLSFERSHFT